MSPITASIDPHAPTVYVMWSNKICIYVGCTALLMRRFQGGHTKRMTSTDRIDIYQFTTLTEARNCESTLIEQLKPKDNKQLNILKSLGEIPYSPVVGQP